MTLALIGDRQALPVAGYASHHSGQQVLVSCSGVPSGAGFDRIEGLVTGAIDVRTQDVVEADQYVAVATSQTLESLLHTHRHALAGRQLLIAPGGFGGALRARDWFRQRGLPAPEIAEATGFPVMGSGDEGVITIRGIKRSLPIAGLDQPATESMLATLKGLLPDLVGSDLVTTSLSNTNHMIHPAIVLFNATRIANGERFRFYREGIIPDANASLEALDSERRTLLDRLGGDTLSLTDWMLRFYADQGMQGERIIELLQTFEPFATTEAPTSLNYRYWTDDVTYGIAAYHALATRLDIPTPHLQAVITLAETMLGQPLQTPDDLVDQFLAYASPAPSPAVPS